jgi:hypothetical protein
MNQTNTVMLAILVALATTTGLVTALSMMSQTALAAAGAGGGCGKGGCGGVFEPRGTSGGTCGFGSGLSFVGGPQHTGQGGGGGGC